MLPFEGAIYFTPSFFMLSAYARRLDMVSLLVSSKDPMGFEKFVVGDVVQLKSGGESMTVEGLDEQKVVCAWFEDKHVNREAFAPEILKKTIERPKPSKWWAFARGSALAVLTLAEELKASEERNERR